MILTGKAVEVAEEFETLNDTLQKQFKIESTPLNEYDQTAFYLIQRMFEIDTAFRAALKSFFILYSGANVENQIPKLLTSLIKLSCDILPGKKS